jgi:hypothetical protein
MLAKGLTPAGLTPDEQEDMDLEALHFKHIQVSSFL